MNASEFLRRRRKTVNLPDGSPVEIRKVSPLDVWAAGGNPDLAALLRREEGSRGFLEADWERLQKFAATLACRAAVSPRLTLKREEPSSGENILHAEDLTAEDLFHLMNEILRWSGLTREAAEALGPFSGTGGSSRGSTPPGSATDAAPAGSSAKRISSPPSASTSPAPGPDGGARKDGRGES
jgi:hypothetical protein